MNWPDEYLNEINSREDLVRYLKQLSEEIRCDSLGVENTTAYALIDAAGRWTRSMDGFFRNVLKEPVPDSPDWAMIGAIFRAALIYE